jgi:uncharacterized membrane protein YgdD (TMEM256/DUF423 family)
MRALVVAASILGLLLVAAGASGAHSIPIAEVRQWDNALLYGFVHTLAAIAAVLLPFRNRLQLASGWAFVAAVVLFSGEQIGKQLWAGMAGASSTPLDGLTMLIPIGGVAFIAGWLLMGLAALMGTAGKDA